MTVKRNIENDLGADEFIDVLLRSGLAARRPVDERERVATMLENSNLIVTARDAEGLDQRSLVLPADAHLNRTNISVSVSTD